MSDATIAAVIPVYNKGRFVARAIHSVLAQSRPVDEIIVVDDASTDDALAQIRLPIGVLGFKLLRRSEPGAGGYAARNLAIHAAKSTWIAFLDADDTWKVDFISEVSRLIAQAPETTGCVFTGFEKVWSNNNVVRDRYSRRRNTQEIVSLDFNEFLAAWLRIGASPIWTSACVIRRKVLFDVGLFPEGRCRLGGDKDTWLRTMAQTNALSSPRSSATYHTLTQNQVTRRETFNSRPCVTDSIEGLLATAIGTRRRLLKRLFNLEVFEQALMASAVESVRPEVYRGFFASLNPLRYAMVLALTHLPAPCRIALRMGILRTRFLFRKLTE